MQQRLQRISSVQVAAWDAGRHDSVEETEMARPLGTKIRWRDQVKRDSKKFGIEERGWFTLAQDRAR